MIISSAACNVLAILVLLYLVVAYAVLFFFGVSFGAFNPLKLQINCIKFHRSRTTVLAKSIRLKFQPFRSDRRVLHFVIQSPKVVLPLNTENGEEPLNQGETDEEEIERYQAKMMEQFSIYSKKSQGLNRLTKYALKLVPHTEITIDDAQLSYSGVEGFGLHLNRAEVKFLFDSAGVSEKTSHLLNFGIAVELHRLFLHLENHLKCDLDVPKETGVFSQLFIKFDCMIDTDEGIVSNTSLNLRLHKFRLPIIRLVQTINHIRKQGGLAEKHVADPSNPNSRLVLQRLLFRANVFVHLVKEISVSIDDFLIHQIPFLKADEMAEVCDSKHCMGPEKKCVFFEVGFNSFNATYTAIRFNHAGYDLKFKKNDKPFQLVLSLMQTKVVLDLSHFFGCKDASAASRYEFLVIPNTNLTMDSNFLNQTLKTLCKKLVKSDAIVDASAAISNPVLDLSGEHLGLIIANAMRVLAVDKGSKKSSTKNNSCFESSSGDSIFLKLLPTLTSRIVLENPKVIVKLLSKAENVISMLILSSSSLRWEFDGATRCAEEARLTYLVSSRFSFSSLHLDLFRREYIETQKKLFDADDVLGNVTLLKLRDLTVRLHVQMAPTVKVFSKTELKYLSLDLGELQVLVIIFNILESVRDTWNTYDSGKGETHRVEETGNIDKCLLADTIFQTLPSWCSGAQFSFHHIKITLGCRSVLMDPSIVTRLDLKGINDRIDGSLRTLVIVANDWYFDLDNPSEFDIKSDSEESSMFASDDASLSESIDEANDHFWQMHSRLGALKCFVVLEGGSASMRHYSHEDVSMAIGPEKFLRVLNGDFKLKALKDKQTAKKILSLSLDCENLRMAYSLVVHFLVLSAFHLLKNTLLSLKKPTEKKEKSNKKGEFCELLNCLVVSSNIEELNAVFVLPHHFKIKLDAVPVSTQYKPQVPLRMRSKLFRLCVESPLAKGYWSTLLSVDYGEIYIHVKELMTKGLPASEEEPWIKLVNQGSRVSIPNQFVLHKLFDNIVTTVKAVKQLQFSFSNNSDRCVIFPKAVHAIPFPEVRFRSKRVVFDMEDDPFEVELNMIYQLGLLEQKRRVAKANTFFDRVRQESEDDQKTKDLTNVIGGCWKLTNAFQTCMSYPVATNAFLNGHRKQSSRRMNSQRSLQSASTPMSRVGNSSFSSYKNKVAQSEFHSSMTAAEKRLYILHKNYSKSWIDLVKSYKDGLARHLDENSQFLWGIVESITVSDGFNASVLESAPCPPLMRLLLDRFELSIKVPRFPLSELPEFMYEVGKGDPKDTEYSILIPTFLDLKMSELRCHLRDYPLPLIYMPAKPSDEMCDNPSIRLSGHYILAEELVPGPAAVRRVYVPLVPSAEKGINDKFFAMIVPRTVASIKSYVFLDMQLNSTKATKIAWGVSYQPVMQQIMMNFDSFSKPELDPSEKIGVWDKMRSVFHGSLDVTCHNQSELVFCIKGSRSPYEVSGDAAGFALIFKKDVRLHMNRDGDAKKFVVATSHEILWAIPNHLAQPLVVWSNDTSKAISLPFSDSFFTTMVGYYLEDCHADEDEVESISEDYCEKINIRLSGGCEFRLGFYFERKAGDGTRTTEFLPHYAVHLIHPDYAPKDDPNYDSYRGFRSDYVHMAIALFSQSTQEPESNKEPLNSVSLSPNSFQLFFQWWKLFGSNMSLPIRNGNLFGPTEASNKFSTHLYTIKFQFLIEPLYLSHIYRSETMESDVDENTIEAIGLKAKIGRFAADLHQRKELVMKEDAVLGTTRKILKMRMNEAEIDITDVDIRSIKALFEDGFSSRADSENVTQPHIDEVGRHIFRVFDGDESWFDVNDFEEFGVCFVHGFKSSIKVTPVLLSPKFTYFRNTDHESSNEQSSDQPFGREPVHDCILGVGKSLDKQRSLLRDRCKEIEDQILTTNEMILKLESTQRHNNARNLTDNLLRLKNSLEMLKSLLHKMDLIEEGKSDQLQEGEVREILDKFLLNQYERENHFNNKFLFHNILLKWDPENRNLVYKYAHSISMRKSFAHFLAYNAVKMVNQVIHSQEESREKDSMWEPPTECLANNLDFHIDQSACSDALKRFHLNLEFVQDGEKESGKYGASGDYLFKLVTPQIQFLKSEDSASCVLVTAPTIELKVLSISQNPDSEKSDSGPQLLNAPKLQTRFGALLQDADVFVVHREYVVGNPGIFSSGKYYGSVQEWPPWLGVDVCHDGALLAPFRIAENTSMMLRYDKNNQLIDTNSFPLDQRDRVIVDVPRMKCTCDSLQYFALYSMVIELLIFVDPTSKKVGEKLEQLIYTTDFENLNGMQDRIEELQIAYKAIKEISKNYDFRRRVLTSQQVKESCYVASCRRKILSELFLLLRVILSGSTSASQRKEQIEWRMRSDGVTLHMLDEKRDPFIDLRLDKGVFRRLECASGAIYNSVDVKEIQAFNLSHNTVYRELFDSFKERRSQEKVFSASWSTQKPVGGIKVIKSFDVQLDAVKVQLEQVTGEKIWNYIFPIQNGTTLNPITVQDKDNSIKQDMKPLESDLSMLESQGENGLNMKHFTKEMENHRNVLRKAETNPRDYLIRARTNSSEKFYQDDGQADDTTESVEDTLNDGTDASAGAVDDMTEMMNRAQNFFSLGSLRIESAVVCVTFQGEGALRLGNVTDFILHLPAIELRNKIWNAEELTEYIKKTVVKILLQKSGSLIGSKFVHHSTLKKHRLKV